MFDWFKSSVDVHEVQSLSVTLIIILLVIAALLKFILKYQAMRTESAVLRQVRINNLQNNV